MHANESARLDPCLRDGNARFDCVGAASEGHDRHDRGPRTRQRLVGGDGFGAREDRWFCSARQLRVPRRSPRTMLAPRPP
eukprot:3255551-Pleurochrysis_carterae.AAC.1